MHNYLLILLVSFCCGNSIQLFHEKKKKAQQLKSAFVIISILKKHQLVLPAFLAKVKSSHRRSKELQVALLCDYSCCLLPQLEPL